MSVLIGTPSNDTLTGSPSPNPGFARSPRAAAHEVAGGANVDASPVTGRASRAAAWAGGAAGYRDHQKRSACSSTCSRSMEQLASSRGTWRDSSAVNASNARVHPTFEGVCCETGGMISRRQRRWSRFLTPQSLPRMNSL